MAHTDSTLVKMSRLLVLAAAMFLVPFSLASEVKPATNVNQKPQAPELKALTKGRTLFSKPSFITTTFCDEECNFNDKDFIDVRTLVDGDDKPKVFRDTMDNFELKFDVRHDAIVLVEIMYIGKDLLPQDSRAYRLVPQTPDFKLHDIQNICGYRPKGQNFDGQAPVWSIMDGFFSPSKVTFTLYDGPSSYLLKAREEPVVFNFALDAHSMLTKE